MLHGSRAQEKEQIKAWKLTWYTHVVNRDKASASQALVNLAAKTINLLTNSDIQPLLFEWIKRVWSPSNDNKTNSPPPSPLHLGQAVAEIMIKNHIASQDSIFIRNAIERIAYVISCIIADNMVSSVSSQAFYVLDEIIPHLQANDTRKAQEINNLIKENMVIDKNILSQVEREFSPQQLEFALNTLGQLHHAKKAELIRVKATLPQTILGHLFRYKTRNFFGEEFDFQYRTDYKIMLAHAWELKEFYKDSHYVFIHGQKQELWIYLKFAKILLKTFFPEKDLSLFNLLKLGNSVSERKSATDFIRERIDERSEDIMRQVLSADGYLFHHQSGESASDFCQKNNNVWSGSLKPFLELFIQDNLQLNTQQYAKTVEHVALLAKEIIQFSDTGNLMVMCIPKDKASDRFYEAHPFGEPCQHNDTKDNLNATSNVHKKRLDDLQNDEYNKDSICDWVRRTYRGLSVAQYRIVINNLDPQEGDRVFILSPLSQYSRNSFKEKLQLLAEQLKNVAHESAVTTLAPVAGNARFNI